MLDNVDLLAARTIEPNEYPFYSDTKPLPIVEAPQPKLAQGHGSKLDSETITNIRAYTTPTPQCLLPLGSDGKFPASVMPASMVGPAGPQGATGSQGPKGERGNTGPQGPTGATGATGPTGNNGLTAVYGNGLITNLTGTNIYQLVVDDDGALAFDHIGAFEGDYGSVFLVFNRSGNALYKLYVSSGTVLDTVLVGPCAYAVHPTVRNRSGNQIYAILVEDDGAISIDPL